MQRRQTLLLGLIVSLLLLAVWIVRDSTAARGDHALTVMPLGDSMTVGWTTTGLPFGGYRVPLCVLIAQAGHSITFVGSQASGPAIPCGTANEGYAGWSIGDLSDHVAGWVAAAHPRVVLLLAGANDMTADIWSYEAPGKMSLLIDQVIKNDPGVHVYVASLPPEGDPTRNARTAYYNGVLPTLVAAKSAPVTYVDLHDALATTDLADGIHPLPTGYAKMAAVWATVLATEVAQTPPFPAPTLTALVPPTLTPTTTASAPPTPAATVTATSLSTVTPTP